MTNNDELALKLKQTAQLVHDNEQISNYGKLEAWKVRFRHTASPANILSLLAERDAYKKRIAEMNDTLERECEKSRRMASRIAELESISAAAEKLVRCKGRYHSEQNYRALAALFGLSTPDLPPLDTESRELELIVPPRRCFDYAALAVQERDEQWHKALHDACDRAGIKLEVGE